MDAWLASHFFNPTIVAGGAALLASPIIIHLINRLRFRRVRFAAMEFLLQSQQMNRRRLLLEQILLLLLRLLIVAALVLLIARLILDPSQLSVFRGAKTHHVVLLDDSGSMRDRWAETSGFQQAVQVVKELIAAGADRPDTQRFSLLLLSRPEQPFVSERDLTEDFQQEMISRLDPQVFSPTHQSLSLTAGLQAAHQYLLEGKGTIRQLHVVSDFRERDWKDQRALSTAIEDLTKSGVTVNLVKTVPERHLNLAVSELSGATQVAAAGVPLRLTIGVRNFSEQAAKDVRVVIADDDHRVPASVLFESIDPQTEVRHEVDLRLASAGKHRLSAALEADPLLADNTRYLAVDVSPTIPVLIIDGDPAGDQAAYLSDALAADPSSTGVSPTVEGIDALRRRPLDGFRCIYLVNVPELPADAVALLEKYVRDGGGLIWYLGNAIRPAYYSDALFKKGEGLFPVPLGTAPKELPADDITSPTADLNPGDHPIFAVLAGDDNPFLKSVRISSYFGVADGWLKDDQQRADRVRTIARLRNNDPLMFEHLFGKGRVITSLTTADPAWNDWPVNPSFVVVQLEMLKTVARSERNLELRVVGEPIRLSLDPSVYTEKVEISVPAADGPEITRLQAAPESAAQESSPGASNQEPSAVQLTAVFRETDRPGVYGVRITDQNQTPEERLLAYNVPLSESELALATTADLRKRLGNNPLVSIQEPGRLDWVQGQEVGSEIRRALLWILLACLLLEQLMAYRLSYHPQKVGALA